MTDNNRVRFVEIATQTVNLTNLLANSLTNCNNVGANGQQYLEHNAVAIGWNLPLNSNNNMTNGVRQTDTALNGKEKEKNDAITSTVCAPNEGANQTVDKAVEAGPPVDSSS